jgi:1-phosphofructokinase
MAIITITVNTAVDEVLEVIQVQSLKATFNTKRRLLFPSGKGINVARAVATLRRSVTVMGFVGDNGLSWFVKQLTSNHIRPSFTQVAGETRVNTTVCDSSNDVIWHIRRPGYSVNRGQYARFERLAKDSLKQGDVVVFAGTLPPGLQGSRFASLISFCRRRGITTILDSSGRDLRSTVRARPFMLKPNIEELTSLLNLPKAPRSTGDLLNAANRLLSRGVQLVVISRGEKGILVRNSQGAWIAQVTLDALPSITGSIGSGDALVAGFAIGLMEGRSLVDTIRLGVACGAANVLSVGPCVMDKGDVNRLYDCVVVRKVLSEKRRS